MLLVNNTNRFVASNPDIDWNYFIEQYKAFRNEERKQIFPDYNKAVQRFYDFVEWYFGGDVPHDNGYLLNQYGNRHTRAYCDALDKDPEQQVYYLNNLFARSVAETCIALVNNTTQRKKLLRRRLKAVFEHNSSVVFITFTFDNLNTLGGNHNLSALSDTDKCKLVVDYLESIGITDYVLNYDYHQSGEVHFHCVAGCDYFDTHDWCDNLKYGYANARRVKSFKSYVHGKPVSEYLCKLSNHCIKATTQGKRIIYSKSTRQYTKPQPKENPLNELLTDAL